MKTKFSGILTLLLALVVQITFAQEKTVSGTVVDENNLPLPGATVLIKGTTTGTSTDFDGKYSIKANTGDVLEISYVGYAAQSATVGTSSTIDVALTTDNALDEVVIAFRKQKKEAITGSTDQIDAKVIEQTPVASLDQLLQGNVTGINSTSTNGNPGARSEVFIRGIASTTGTSEPIYIMDGVRISAGDFKTINSGDIADVSVLKDPSSAALYGARGANGVILITTKKGKKGDGVVEFESSVGYNDLTTTNFDMMNAQEYMTFQNILNPGSFTDQDIANATNTDWQDVFFRDPITHRNQLTFSGGNDNMTYYVSGAHYNQEGILERSGLERSTLRTNISGDVKDWITIGTNLSLGYSEEDVADDFGVNTNSPVTQAYLNLPTSSAFNPDGSINNNQAFGFNALEQTRINSDKRDQFKLVGNAFADVKLTENLKYSLSVGIDYRTNYRKRFFKPGTNLGDQQDNGQLLITDNRIATFNHLSKLQYDLRFKEDHKITLLAGAEFERFRRRNGSIDIQNFDFVELDVPDGGSNPVAIGGTEDNATFTNYFFNVDYSYKNRYFLTGSISNSADSRFAEDVRSDIFYSIGASWVASNESFLQDVSWIDNLKLRAGYGLTGNNNTSSLYESNTFYGTSTYGGSTGILSPSVFRGTVGWEKVDGYNAGIDFKFLDRIYGSVDFYQNETRQLIFERPTAPSTTFTTLVTNVEGGNYFVNKGYELELAVDVLKGDDYKITLGGNYSYNKNQVFYDQDGQTGIEDTGRANAWFGDGEALGTWYLVRFAGVNPANGEPLWYDANGNITNVYDEDNNSVILSGKSQYAPINGGFFGNFTYKGFDLSARFSFQKDKWMSNNTRFFTENTNFSQFNQSTAMLNIWQQPGDITDIPRAGSGSQFDSHLLEDASFLRLKNLTLSYTLPSKFAESLKLKGFRIYAQGQNLLTWTEYKGIDPETNSRFDGFSYPVSRSYLVGVNIKL